MSPSLRSSIGRRKYLAITRPAVETQLRCVVFLVATGYLKHLKTSSKEACARRQTTPPHRSPQYCIDAE